MTTDNDVLRKTFNQEASLYHSMRSRYPEMLFDSIVKISNLKDDAELLEIAPGTGQATEAFAKRGYKITAVELGAELASIGATHLSKYPDVKFINAPFETVDLPPKAFDLVYVATALHWIQPDYQFTKPYQLLKSDGHFAIITTTHISDDDGDEFYFASNPIYEKYDPGDLYAEDARLKCLDEVQSFSVDETLFELSYFKAFPLKLHYSAEEYVQLINTYSPTISMEPASRISFLRDMGDLINEAFAGSVQKCYAMGLTIVKKK